VSTSGTISSVYKIDLEENGAAVFIESTLEKVTLLNRNSSTLTTKNGDITIRGVGVEQTHVGSVINAGSGQIVVDGGAGTIKLAGSLKTIYDETGYSTDGPDLLKEGAAVTIINASSVELRVVEAIHGTLQIGLVGNDTLLATQQDVNSDSLLTLSGDKQFYVPRRVSIALSGNPGTGSTFDVVGKDGNNQEITNTVTISDPNLTAITDGFFSEITSIKRTDSGGGSVSVVAGLASERISGAVTQSSSTSSPTPKLDLQTLSVATDLSLTITSSSNIIDRLGDVSIGNTLRVDARGRATGISLTGDVVATDVRIWTGQSSTETSGILDLGDFNITATSGNVLLGGRGISQESESHVLAFEGTVTLVGTDLIGTIVEI